MKNQFSVGFLHSIAAHAGIEFWTSSSDFNGVDATLRTYARYERRAGAKLHIQLKCTSQTAIQQADHISWSLGRDAYVKLSDPDRFSLGVLAVLVVTGSPPVRVTVRTEGGALPGAEIRVGLWRS